ncbi:MAG: hypothetical protein JXA10_14065 [Anaerolineae bacterium]|nr:hypothetical protein [Anaerolineae bacterium]
MSESADSTPNLELTREYSTPYNALIRDDVVMGVPRYFLERWVPILGTNAATVVNTLRQLTYRCSREQPETPINPFNQTVTISGTALAREATMSRRHLYTCLETDWITAFIRLKSGQKVRSANGKITQKANHYYVRMDDPLTPADADHLCQLLPKLADTPLDAAQRALAHDPRDLWASDVKQAGERFTEPRAITARDVLLRAFPFWTPATDEAKRQFAELSEALHRHMTLVRDDGKTSKIIVPQYFRTHWWPHLGHDLAWAYLWLRGYVYDNPAEGIRRDTCWIPSLNTLLDVINRPREWWRRNVEKKKPDAAWSLDVFFQQQDSQKGRDPANPQWVARQYWIALDIPVAPEDQARYTHLLSTWDADTALVPDASPDPNHATSPAPPPPEQIDQTAPPIGSATPEHTGNAGVCHISTHRRPAGPPHSDTPVSIGSATPEHTGNAGVCHIHAQGSATSAHRILESSEASNKNNQNQNNSKHQVPIKPKPNATESAKTTATETAGAAATKNNSPLKQDSLIDHIADKLDNAPETPLYACAEIEMWLQQTWLEPIRPYTPAWNAVKTGQVTPRDMIAIMLAIWADTAIKQPPRYLSWLIQRWQAQPDVAPVDQWARWQALAEMPIGQWAEQGRRAWLELAPRDNRALPFGLDAILETGLETTSPARESLLRLAEQQADIDAFNAQRAQAVPPEPPPKLRNGLDVRLGDGTTTISDIWQATLGQLSDQITRSTYQEWVEGTQAVSYMNGVLTVQAKHVRARDWLSKQLNASIEATASALANIPITVRYIS